MQLATFHFPDREPSATGTKRFGEAELLHAEPTAAELSAALSGARHAAERLAAMPRGERLSRLERLLEAWIASPSDLRTQAEAALPAVTGFSKEMVHAGLQIHFDAFSAQSMNALLDEELGAVGHAAERRAKPLVAHIVAGNIPGLAFKPMLLSLAVGCPVLVKSAAGDPLSAALLARSLFELEPELGACVVVAHWRGGDEALENVAFAEADVVCASGNDESIAAIAPRVRGRFIGHGHKISFAVIGKEMLSARNAISAAQDLAFDTCMWDQQGCLSPQLAFIESGGEVGTDAFAMLLARELESLAHRLPPRQLSFAERAAIARFRQDAEWRGATALASSSSEWSISVEPRGDFLPSCLNRCLRLMPVADLLEVSSILAPQRRYLEAAGISVGPERQAELVASMVSAGVHRVCALGEMQRPPLSWRQGGRPCVAELLSS